MRHCIALILTLALLNESCGKDDDSSTTETPAPGECGEDASIVPVPIPSVSMTCTTATDCADNTADDKVDDPLTRGDATVFWILHGGGLNGTTSSCETSIVGIEGDTLARGTSSLSCTDGECTFPTPLETWSVVVNDKSVAKLCPDKYTVCLQIDTNGLAAGNTGEPFLQQVVELSDTTSALTLTGGDDIQ